MFLMALFGTGAAYVKKSLMLNMIAVFPSLFHDLHFPVDSHHCLEWKQPPRKNLPEKLPAPFAAHMRTTGGKNKVFKRSIKSTQPSEQANKSALRDESRPAGKQGRTASSAEEGGELWNGEPWRRLSVRGERSVGAWRRSGEPRQPRRRRNK